MFSIYFFTLLIGGAFVALSIFGGLDHDFDFFHDLDPDFDTDVEITSYENPQKSSFLKRFRRRKFPRLPVTSLKFWTFGGCFFGLTGVLLSVFFPILSPKFIAIISIIIGVICGTSLVIILRQLRNNQADSLVNPDDLVGLLAVVELPFDNNCKGKIRVNVKDTIVDLIALTENPKGFIKGEKVLIVGMENNKVWVVEQ
jgi:membrane protein implicated in regulation of membrane protease activity